MGAVPGKQLEPVQCPLCEFVSKRLTTFEQHLTSAHSTTPQQQWDALHGGPRLCACGCGQATTWHGWKQGYGQVVIGHNGNLEAVYGTEGAQLIADKRRQKVMGRTGWSKGLTKDTDDRVARRARATGQGRKAAFAAGNIAVWSKGLTKDTDNRVDAAARAQADRFATGELVPWAKGGSKETDPRIAAMAAKVSLTHRRAGLRRHLDDLKRLEVSDVKQRIEATGKLKVDPDGLSGYVNDNTANVSVTCTNCGATWCSSLRKLQHGRCYSCDPGGSMAQQQVADWLRGLGIEVDTNRRDLIGGLEVDVFIPAKNLAVEFNGLYWHCLLQKSDIYHQHKSELCRAAGITLFHVFEDEWRDRRPIVHSMLLHRLGMAHEKLGARECSVTLLGTKERRAFFEANHIDGDTNASVAFGLKRGDQLVAAMSLRTPMHRKHRDALEIARAACLVNTSVVGWLSRLTAACIEEARSRGNTRLLSYVDTRFGVASNWVAAGWRVASETTPRFWWTDFHDRFNRFKYKADKSRGMTEAQVAAEAGVVRIYGCRNTVLEIALMPCQPTSSGSNAV